MVFLIHMLLASTLSFSVPIQGNPNTEYREYNELGVERIEVVNTSGKITISPLLVNQIAISVLKHKFTAGCKIQIEKPTIGTVLARIEGQANDVCEADIDLKVPSTIKLDIRDGSGSVDIKGVSGDLKFDLGSGSLTATGRFKKITGTAGSGNVEINGVTGGGSLNVGTGSLNMRFLSDPRGDLDIRVGLGSTTLLFPKNAKFKSSLVTAGGDVHNEFSDSAISDYSVSVKAGLGNLEIKGYE